MLKYKIMIRNFFIGLTDIIVGILYAIGGAIFISVSFIVAYMIVSTIVGI